MLRTLCVLYVLCSPFCLAQPYRCDWSVVGFGGGEMTGNYKCGSTVGQTAAGPIAGANYWALIGFWQPEGATGVREAQWSSGQAFKTRLYRPFPTPAARSVTIRYTLDAEHQTLLQVHDLTGRVVRTLCASSMKRGAYSVVWDGRDQNGRSLANGVYFVRLVAGDYRATEKVVLQR
ncbi:T9SS type A sorting domain-containing protein [candidate division WOR-3 bacterium]|uniref:T9SS type A sorting domain-containing protein n=1 Tax=candidate division WOR-3 bacterium TaxID=2052148 RepID=A0A937XCA6_UNCW3|nr:T9SS type A sorting domain-containing protein [candidate division WOR-3 bacterium]